MRRRSSDWASGEIIHAVRSDGFAGVERYVAMTANELHGRGFRVHVVGGEPVRMTAELARDISHTPAASAREVWLALAARRGAGLVHVHMTAAEAAAVASRVRHRAPIVSTRHFPDPRIRSRLLRPAASLIRRSLARQIAISEFVATGIAEPAVLIANGVSPRPAAGLVAPRVIMLQRLELEKAPQVAVRAWAASGLARDGWEFVVAGSGSLAPLVASDAAALGVGDSVIFAGTVDDTDALLSRSSALLAPAPAEPFGLAVVEAMAHGVPVVAADGGAHRETLGEDGLFFEPGDAQAAATHLRRLADDPATRREVGTRLRERQRRLFTLDTHVSRLEELYASLGVVPAQLEEASE